MHRPFNRRLPTFQLESLERRACPAVVAIAGPPMVSEADGPVTLTVTLSEAQRAPVTVNYFLTGSATNGQDYTLAAGTRRLAAPSGSITIAAGQTSVPITLTPINDTIREGDEYLSIRIVRPAGHTLGNAETRVTILDTDNYTASFGGPDRVPAGQPATFTLRLSSPATKVESFTVSTVGGLAVFPGDFGPLTRLPIVFRPGEIEKTVRVMIEPNDPEASDKSFYLVAAPAAADMPAVPPKRVQIIGSGEEPPLTISVTDVSVVEGNRGVTSAVFEVSLSYATQFPVTVDYVTRDGSATVADDDYRPAAGSLRFAPRQTSLTVSVDVLGDRWVEPDETFFLELSNPVGAALAKGTGIATILNDDGEDAETPGFQIDVNYLGTVPQMVRTAVERAVLRWEQVIVGDVPGMTNPFNGQWVDDMVLDVRMGLLGTEFPTGSDGPGNTVANAGPAFGGAPGENGFLAIRPAPMPRLPFHGAIGFDPADVTGGMPAEELYRLSLHEIGHALGFGSFLFELSRPEFPDGMIVGTNFVGPNAVAQYNEIFGTTADGVPLETDGGSGTALAHWSKEVFGTEVMTGYGEIRQLSRVTLGAMADLGYQVDYAAADPFTPPTAAGMVTAPGSMTAWSDRRFDRGLAVGPAPKVSPVVGPLPMRPVASAPSLPLPPGRVPPASFLASVTPELAAAAAWQPIAPSPSRSLLRAFSALGAGSSGSSLGSS
jgi:hypothetical protein